MRISALTKRFLVRNYPWIIEVRFRDIKANLGMELLRTKSPEMVRKEILMLMILYNLIRLLILKAGSTRHVSHRRLSFRCAQQTLHACRTGFANPDRHPKNGSGRLLKCGRESPSAS